MIAIAGHQQQTWQHWKRKWWLVFETSCTPLAIFTEFYCYFFCVRRFQCSQFVSKRKSDPQLIRNEGKLKFIDCYCWPSTTNHPLILLARYQRRAMDITSSQPYPTQLPTLNSKVSTCLVRVDVFWPSLMGFSTRMELEFLRHGTRG